MTATFAIIINQSPVLTRPGLTADEAPCLDAAVWF